LSILHSTEHDGNAPRQPISYLRRVAVVILVTFFCYVNLLEKLDMRNLPRLLIATALSTLALSTVSLTWADDTDPVKSASPPYKPGRQIDDSGSTPAADSSDPVKTSRPPYKAGRELDDDGQPVKPGRAPYKPGREADDTRDASDSANN
jgi:hypothetical protein